MPAGANDAVLRQISRDVNPSVLDEAESLTRENTATRLVIAFNYGARDEITRAARVIAQQVADGECNPDDITSEQFASALDTADWSDPELIMERHKVLIAYLNDCLKRPVLLHSRDLQDFCEMPEDVVKVVTKGK